MTENARKPNQSIKNDKMRDDNDKTTNNKQLYSNNHDSDPTRR